MGLVIDTSALVALERAEIGWDDALSRLGDEPVALPAIVYAELLVGVHLAGSPVRARERRAKIAALATRVPIVEFDAEVAERWADRFADLRRKGRLIPRWGSLPDRPEPACRAALAPMTALHNAPRNFTLTG